MKKLLAFAAMIAMVLLALSADAEPPVKKKAPAKKGAAKTATRKGATTAAKKGAPGKKGPAKKGVTWRNRQLAPTPQRYHEIQDALVAKGYLKSEDATGAWNQNSIDALKKFQSEQHLEPSGKINSLS